MSRTLPEWVGASDDSAIPQRVRLRVFEKYAGRCYLTGKKLGPGSPWQIDHIKAIIAGGENRETNLAPISVDKHREKTREDVKTKAKVARVKARHVGVKTSGRKLQSRGFDKRLRKRMDGTVERRDA